MQIVRNPVIAAAGFHEPSLVFLHGTRTRLIDGSSAAEFLRRGDCRYAVIESRQERAFAQRAELIGLRYRLRGAAGERVQHQWRPAGHVRYLSRGAAG